MRRTEALQGVRMVKFMDILSRYESADFNQLEAAALLGIGERTFRRWRQRFEDEGEAGLLDRRLGKQSGKRVPSDRGEEVEALYRARYCGFTAKHFHEQYIRVMAFDATHGCESVKLSFIVNRPKEEPGFRLTRTEGVGRNLGYAISPYATDRPSGKRYS